MKNMKKLFDNTRKSIQKLTMYLFDINDEKLHNF